MYLFSKKFILFWLLAWISLTVFAQNTRIIRGMICDTGTKECIKDVSVATISGKIKTKTDINGQFQIEIPRTKPITIITEHPDYKPYKIEISDETNFIHLHLQPKTISLNTMTVTAQSKHTLAETAISGISVNRSFFQKTNANTLSASLAKLPGVASMNVGTGVSKPVIRGMGFNRIAVVDKGIVIQNQQWGADHGLEIDQYDIDQLIVYKGPMSLFYGSDAMGGVIEILPAETPDQDQIWGDISLTAKSNNDLLGTTAGLNIKNGNWFYRFRTSANSYGDYRIPADTINYLSWKIPVARGRMKNTAGRAVNISGSAVYKKNDFSMALFVSNNFSKNGFYPGAHGIPILKRLDFDGTHRNIELPYSQVNHLKISNTTEFPIFNNWNVHTDIGFQNNQRVEMSLFHTHFPNQAIPEKNPNQELAFILNTFSGNIRVHNSNDSQLKKTFGISAEQQINRIGGYSFLMPEFDRFTVGIFGATNYEIDEKWTLSGGLRFDLGKINTSGFYDNILEEYFISTSYAPAIAKFYAQRASELNLTFNNFSGAMGIILRPNRYHLLKANLGRSFRFPTPNELASNGVHHGAFRYERGNEKLNPETGLQLDMEYEYSSNKWHVGATPFINYFSNYIFLNPTGQWSLLPHTGQQYEYTQSKALMTGGEIDAQFQALDFLKLASNLEYVYTLNINSSYSLPYAPPTKWTSNVLYSSHGNQILTNFSVNAEMMKIFTQRRIANNEITTPGATLFNLAISLNWKLGYYRLISEIQAYNIFNTAYLNHLSYYRKLNAPEPGRNIQILLKLPF